MEHQEEVAFRYRYNHEGRLEFMYMNEHSPVWCTSGFYEFEDAVSIMSGYTIMLVSYKTTWCEPTE